jgi:hypothetical protein
MNNGNKITIVTPINFISTIHKVKTGIFQFEPGDYYINHTFRIYNKCMMTALDNKNKPNIFISVKDNYPGIHLLTDDIVINNMKFYNNNMNCTIIRNDGNNVKIINNDFTRCRISIVSGGNDTIIKENLISQFTQDGIQFSGQRTNIINNVIQDLILIKGDSAHHHDAIQAWAGDPDSPLNSKDRYTAKYQLEDAIIKNNIIISTTDINRNNQGALQGITAFDGWMSGWNISNNFINTHSTIHGITILGAINSNKNKFKIYDNKVYMQTGNIIPEIYIKPARVWDENNNTWNNVFNNTWNVNINNNVDYDILTYNNSCKVNKIF